MINIKKICIGQHFNYSNHINKNMMFGEHNVEIESIEKNGINIRFPSGTVSFIEEININKYLSRIPLSFDLLESLNFVEYGAYYILNKGKYDISLRFTGIGTRFQCDDGGDESYISYLDELEYLIA